MKSTGIVRRLDGLGRIVIPKEIRNNMYIKDGDSLEIFIDNDSIILKKFSNIDNIAVLANDIVTSINYIIDENVIITDLEKVISCSGSRKKELMGKYISKDLYNIIIDRRSNVFNKEKIMLIDNEENLSFAITPILVNSEIIGSIMILANDRELCHYDLDIIKMMSMFFKKYLED